MNTLKKTLALMAALAMTATAFASCGDDEKDSSSERSSSKVESSEEATEEATEESGEESSEATASGEIDSSVATGGDTFTVAAWNADDVPALLAQWKGQDFDTMKADLAEKETVDGIHFINFGVGGQDASEKYDQLFDGGEDLDVYFVEADWALKYIGDDEKTLPLEKLGITDAELPNIFSFTDEIGKTKDGVRKGVSWQCAAGGFGYRADLAKEYLGVESPEAMQEKIGDWDKFVEAAKTVNEKSSGQTALADTLGGLWQAYACGRKTPWVVDNKLNIDDFCKDFADTAKALWDCGGITQNTQWSPEWTAAGTNDSCMGYFVSTWGFGGFFLDAAGGEGGATYGNWAVCEGPQPYFWGGTWMVVNPKTDNGDLAREFILSATSDENQLSAYATAKPEFVNNSKVMDDLISANTVFNKTITDNLGGQNFYSALADNAKGINFNGLITEYDATIKADFTQAVKEQYLEGGASYEDTLEAFKDLVSEHITTIEID